jgi:hypothetical protein
MIQPLMAHATYTSKAYGSCPLQNTHQNELRLVSVSDSIIQARPAVLCENSADGVYAASR